MTIASSINNRWRKERKRFMSRTGSFPTQKCSRQTQTRAKSATRVCKPSSWPRSRGQSGSGPCRPSAARPTRRSSCRRCPCRRGASRATWCSWRSCRGRPSAQTRPCATPGRGAGCSCRRTPPPGADWRDMGTWTQTCDGFDEWTTQVFTSRSLNPHWKGSTPWTFIDCNIEKCRSLWFEISFLNELECEFFPQRDTFQTTSPKFDWTRSTSWS